MNESTPSVVPHGWPEPTTKQLAHAVTFTLKALGDDAKLPVEERLRVYYRRQGNYAGASFAEMQPNPPTDLIAADLHAITLLAVSVEPRATRRLLDDGDERIQVLSALVALDDLGVTSLRHAPAAVFDAMEKFSLAVKAACVDPNSSLSNPWVTVAKLCARKRPGLFPVRDTTVCTALGLLGKGGQRGNWQIDWQVYQQLLTQLQVAPRLDAAVNFVAGLAPSEYAGDQHELRILDAALWTYQSWQSRADREGQEDADRVKTL